MHDTFSNSANPESADRVLQQIPALRAYARGLTRRADEADDLVQETLMKAIADIAEFQKGTNLRAWLFKIMRNSFLSNVCKYAHEAPSAIDCASTLPVAQPTHVAHITVQHLLAGISRLPDRYREILMLVVVIGESYEDAARLCDCAVGTVKSRTNRARKMIMEDLGAYKPSDVMDATK